MNMQIYSTAYITYSFCDKAFWSRDYLVEIWWELGKYHDYLQIGGTRRSGIICNVFDDVGK